jgi:hypothetical protein
VSASTMSPRIYLRPLRTAAAPLFRRVRIEGHAVSNASRQAVVLAVHTPLVECSGLIEGGSARPGLRRRTHVAIALALEHADDGFAHKAGASQALDPIF